MQAFPFIQRVALKPEDTRDDSLYPFDVQSLRHFSSMEFSQPVTFIIGENGSGKSTLVEAIAIAYGFNPEGGSKNFNFSTEATHADLAKHLRLSKSFKRASDGFFLRAESFYNVATNIDELNRSGGPPLINSYGGKSLHQQSHGESFLSLILNRFGGNGVYILDEPEAALSPTRQLTLLSAMKQLCDNNSQFIIATHSPMLLAYPHATIYQVTNEGLKEISYKETDHYLITKSFLNNPKAMLDELFNDD
jgi:predicted ATPase